MSNVLGADFTKYCQQMHQGNGGGLGGTTATHNSIEYSNESYDAKTRTVTMHAVIDWSDPYRFGDSTGSFTAPDITVVFDKSGKIQRIDSTVWGFPPARLLSEGLKHARSHQRCGSTMLQPYGVIPA